MLDNTNTNPSSFKHFLNNLPAHIVETERRLREIMDDILEFYFGQHGNWFFSADTGTGKTTAYIKLVSRTNGCRFAIALPTVALVDDVARKLLELEVDVGVWTNEHDPTHRHTDCGLVPGTPKEFLRHKRVIVGTHKFLMSSSPQARSYVGERDLMIVDEVPVSFEGGDTLDPEVFYRAWLAARKHDLQHVRTFHAIHNWAEGIAKDDTIDAQYIVEIPKICVEPETWKKITKNVIESGLDSSEREAIMRVVRYIEAARERRAFVQRRSGAGAKEFGFKTTRMTDPTVPRILHVSATVELEGWQVSPEGQDAQRFKHGAPVDYHRLDVSCFGWPKKLPHRYDEIVRSLDNLDQMWDELREAIGKTPESADVLLVVPAKLIEHVRRKLKDPTLSFDPVFESRKVRVTHYKVDVGSNEYRKCKDVILFGLHHSPKTSHIQRAHQFSREAVTQNELDMQKGSLVGLPKEIRFGDHMAQIKQLGARGNVRQIETINGKSVCGNQRLWIYQSEIKPAFIKDLFPGCKLIVDQSAHRGKQGVGKNQDSLEAKIIRGLQCIEDREDEQTLRRLAEDVRDRNLTGKATRIKKLQDTWELHGWTFVSGTRGKGGHKARFVRTGKLSTQDRYRAFDINPEDEGDF